MLLAPLDRAKTLPSAVWKTLGSALTGTRAGLGTAGKAEARDAEINAGDTGSGTGVSTALLTRTGGLALMVNGPAAGAMWCATARGRATMRTTGSLIFHYIFYIKHFYFFIFLPLIVHIKEE